MIRYIKTSTPVWFTIKTIMPDSLSGVTNIDVPEGAGTINVMLQIEQQENTIIVRETGEDRRYPERCFQRHIQPDGSFCIGLNAGTGINNYDEARNWWGRLEVFLKLQRVAGRTRLWPHKQELAHGIAGQKQIEAFNAARLLGIEEDYLKSLSGEIFWFNRKWPKINKATNNILNLRLPCPKGCKKKKKAILRADCKKSKHIFNLLNSERERKIELEKFWETVVDCNYSCCNTMMNCPIRDKNSDGQIK